MSDPQPDDPASVEPSSWVEVYRGSADRVDGYAVVLQAVGISSAVASIDGPSAGGYGLTVRVEDAQRARRELARFVQENRGWPPRAVVSTPVTMGVGAALVYAALLIIMFAAEEQQSWGVDWMGAGSASAARIQAGEWWRAITALALHADSAHLSGNMLFGALFGVMLAQSVGAGTAWLAFIVTGAIGNWANAWWQPAAHEAIGASTGVFGLLGAQVAYDWMRRGRTRYHRMRRLAPIIMGVALLAWFGGSGGDPLVDVGAHVWGFGAGLVLGALLGWRTPAWLVGPRTQHGLTAAAIGLVVLAWGLAIRFR